MDSPDIIPDSQPDSCEPPTSPRTPDDYSDDSESESEYEEDEDEVDEDEVDEDEAEENFQNPNLPNVNVPEHIIICLDVCYDEGSSLYRLGDGTSFTPLNMLKRVLDFFIYSKHAINKKTQFALLILQDSQPFWVHDFTNNLKDIIDAVDFLSPEESTAETFDFTEVFRIIQNNVEVPDFKQSECIEPPPPFIVRMIVLYSRSNCVPQIATDDDFFNLLKNEMYFFIDILLAHEDECALYKCEEIYDSLQDLDNGYSYVYEVPRNPTKIHDCIAKLLAHPLQRPLQKNTEYAFGSCRNPSPVDPQL